MKIFTLILCIVVSTAYAKEQPQISYPKGYKPFTAVKPKPVVVKRQTDYGMTKSQVLASTWGAPINRVRDGGYEWWDYGCDNWLLFYGGELVEFYTPE